MRIIAFARHLAEHSRSKLSHYPILFAFIGGVGIIVFWRGIWHTADYVMEHYFSVGDVLTSRSSFALPWWDGPMSILLGGVLLLMTGLFVSTLIGDEIITSELKKEKKMVEESEKEEEKTVKEIRALNRRLANIEKLLKK